MEGCDLDFSAWLPQALQQGLVIGVGHVNDKQSAL
jgi:hypothetical protein